MIPCMIVRSLYVAGGTLEPIFEPQIRQQGVMTVVGSLLIAGMKNELKRVNDKMQ